MSKKYSKHQLKLKTFHELQQISNEWNLKNKAKTKPKLLEQIYNHQDNQQKSKKKQNSYCSAKIRGECIKFGCLIHKQCAVKFKKQTQKKVLPTKFLRFPLPICWFVAGIQFLAPINWPKCF